MKAAVYFRYGPPEVVSVGELPQPTPRPDEILVRVRAASVSTGDWRVRTSIAPPGFGPLVRLAFGVFKPRNPVLGTDLAGEVVGVGAQVTRFKVGDRVLASTGMRMGAHAEYKALRENSMLVRLPDSISYEDGAALVFGGATALYFLRDLAKVQPVERVLINGASGSVGSAAVQIAKHLGAKVTGVCSLANAEWVRGLGADQVIDYSREDYTRGSNTYDVVIDTVGNGSFERCERVLVPGGRLGLVVGSLGQLIGGSLRPMRKGKRLVQGTPPEKAEILQTLVDWASQGILRPSIDRVLPLEQVVEAHRRVDSHRKRGNVILTF